MIGRKKTQEERKGKTKSRGEPKDESLHSKAKKFLGRDRSSNGRKNDGELSKKKIAAFVQDKKNRECSEGSNKMGFSDRGY